MTPPPSLAPGTGASMFSSLSLDPSRHTQVMAVQAPPQGVFAHPGLPIAPPGQLQPHQQHTGAPAAMYGTSHVGQPPQGTGAGAGGAAGVGEASTDALIQELRARGLMLP